MSPSQGHLFGDIGIQSVSISDQSNSVGPDPVLPQTTQQEGGQSSEEVVAESLSSNRDSDMPVLSPNPPAEALLPAFSSRRFSHLPTPQSPTHLSLGQYVGMVPYTPESPEAHGSHTTYPTLAPPIPAQRLVSYRPTEIFPTSPYKTQQTMTPESSPFVTRSTSPRLNTLSTPTQASTSTDTPRATSSSVKLEPPLPTLAPAHRISLPIHPAPAEPTRAHLSSPFMAKLSLSDRDNNRTPIHPQLASPKPIHVADLFATNHIPMAVSTPPHSPRLPSGGEMERIRLKTMEDRRAQYQETESRRPDYLKRAKRTLLEADPSANEGVELAEREIGLPGVGITVSPHKGRRLKLFQETSEESFEESLMAGGYGRYRTSDWLLQPQPTPGPPGPSNIISLLEAEAPLSEKEVKKQKRLAAFRESSSVGKSPTKLLPVELEGKGRVLLDVTAEEPPHPELTPVKKRGGNRRKKKGTTVESFDQEMLPRAQHEVKVEKPNWPDSEFPWRLRTEERAEIARAEEEERLKWIERFLDRDSDEEEEAEEEHTLPSSAWGQVLDSDLPVPFRRGRGKMVPLRENPSDSPAEARRGSALFPSDPADARAALLSKKSVRALSYRQQRKNRDQNDDEESDDEVVCICNGRVDGRELVQCDACQTWYHLQCIGIRNIAELGREEDPWFCENCMARRLTPEPTLLSEPTFVPTDDRPTHILKAPYDPPFFQASLQDSPVAWSSSRAPSTPTRAQDSGPEFSSGSSWIDSSASKQNGPTTPQYPYNGVRVYTTPTAFDSFPLDESPFDPTSTPSRGIRFGAPFTTPKNPWSTRANGLFHTPSKSGVEHGSDRALPGGSLSLPNLDDGANGYSPYRSLPWNEDSPIRRTEASKGAFGRRTVDSPLVARPLNPSHFLLEESPVMRSSVTDRRQELPTSDTRERVDSPFGDKAR